MKPCRMFFQSSTSCMTIPFRKFVAHPGISTPLKEVLQTDDRMKQAIFASLLYPKDFGPLPLEIKHQFSNLASRRVFMALLAEFEKKLTNNPDFSPPVKADPTLMRIIEKELEAEFFTNLDAEITITNAFAKEFEDAHVPVDDSKTFRL